MEKQSQMEPWLQNELELSMAHTQPLTFFRNFFFF